MNVEHPAVRRLPAREVEALDRGVAAARAMQRAGLFDAAYLALQGRRVAC